MSADFGKDYLRSLAEKYSVAKKMLPGLGDDEFQRIKNQSNRRDVGVESFLMDFAVDAEERRRNTQRWVTGAKLPSADQDKATAVHSALPAYTFANPEAVGGMHTSGARSFKVDVVVEDILTEIAQRLPRRVDAYRYRQDYAHETLPVPGLGEVKVTMHESGDGIFKTIGTVEAKTFRIWNCRSSGVGYLDRIRDISKPSEIRIEPKKMEIKLYDDNSGIFVELKGKKFTNSRVRTAVGRGYDSDADKDELYRTSNDYGWNEDWRKDKTVHSWKKIEEDAILWLANKVLKPLKEAPKPASQLTTPPEPQPFPEGKVGQLFTFVEMRDLRRIAAIKDDPSKAYPDERKGMKPSTRLLPLDIALKGVDETAQAGFVWCGIGQPEPSQMDELSVGTKTRRTDRLFGSNEGLATIKPKSADDVYVVDWSKWNEFRDKTFKPGHDRLTEEEYGEMHREVARTLIPISDYKGDYKEPVVLIARDIELDEIDSLHLPPEEKVS